MNTSATLKTLHGSTWRTTRVTRRTRGRRPTSRGTGATWCDDNVVVTYGASGGAIGASGTVRSALGATAEPGAGGAAGMMTGNGVGATE